MGLYFKIGSLEKGLHALDKEMIMDYTTNLCIQTSETALDLVNPSHLAHIDDPRELPAVAQNFLQEAAVTKDLLVNI